MDNLGNYPSKALDNQFRKGVQYSHYQFKENIQPKAYQAVCNRNLKLLRRIDTLNLTNQKLLEENTFLNNAYDNLEKDLLSLESNFKALNSPFNNCLQNAKCSYSVISFLILLFISLFNNCLGIIKRIKEIKLTIKGNL